LIISANGVRLAVIQGFNYIIENMPLSHLLFKTKLKKVSPLLNDKTTTVRIAFLDLLLTINKIQSIKFYEIVQVAHLLRILREDLGPEGRRTAGILMGSFWPLDGDHGIQVSQLILKYMNSQLFFV